MKRCLITLLLIILLIPTFIYAKDTCDESNVSIIDVTNKEMKGKLIEEEKPSIVGKGLKFNLRFYEVGDEVTYSFKIENESDNDFLLNEKDFEIDSDYLTYSLITNDNNMVVKANSTKEFQLRIAYTDEVPSTSFDNHEYNSSNSFQLNLSNNSLGDNPKTGTIPTMIIMSVVLSIIIILSLLNMKKLVYYVLLVGFALLIPNTVYALCTLNLQITNNYKISNRPLFCVTVDNDKTYYYEYEEGMTFEDYMDSSYNRNTFKFNEIAQDSSYIIYSNHENYGVCNGFKYSSDNLVGRTETIKNLDCYRYETEFCGFH